MSEHEKKDAQESVIKNQEREETEPQAQTVNWAWAANIKKTFEDALNAATANLQQDVTRRNTANGTLDKLDAIFTTDLAARLSIEREDQQARLAAERTNAEQMRSNERVENKAKDLLFNNAHFFTLNWLYEYPEMWINQAARNETDSRTVVMAAFVDYLRKLADSLEPKKPA